MTAKGSSALGQGDIKGDGWRPVVCLDDGQNDRENTGLDFPYGDSKRNGNIVNPFTVGKGRGVGMVGPRIELLKCGWEKQVAATKEGNEKLRVDVARGRSMRGNLLTNNGTRGCVGVTQNTKRGNLGSRFAQMSLRCFHHALRWAMVIFLGSPREALASH